jgi:predicted nucleic acid-binding protein
MIIADSSVWIDFLRDSPLPHVELLAQAKAHDELILGDLVLAEILQGISRRKDFNLIRFVFDQLECRALGGYDIVMDAADNYQRLRKKGFVVRKTIDFCCGSTARTP